MAETLALIDYGKARVARSFANGELIALVGEAERAGNQTPIRIAQYIMAAKSMDSADEKLRKRIIFSVRDGRKR